MRIAIVNDTSIAVEALRRILLTVPGYDIAWTARTGAEAIAHCALDRPDLVLMDLIMPGIDGVEAIRQIMHCSPCAILIVTANSGNTAKVFEAMGYGALDVVDTPTLGSSDDAIQRLLKKINTVSKLIGKPNPSPPLSCPLQLPPLIAIGASTGGPKVLATILSQLPAEFGAAIVVVQHVDAQFAGGLIEWLNHYTPLTVKSATMGDRPEKGTVLVANTNDHLQLQSNGTLSYTQFPIEYPYRPSIDVFFKSVAQFWTAKGAAILLTGMGRDGAEGLKQLRTRGWHTIAQNRESSVIYGMPKAAIELNAAIEVLDATEIASSLLHRTLFTR